MTIRVQTLAAAAFACFCSLPGHAAAAPAAAGETGHQLPKGADTWPGAAVERAVRAAADVQDPYRRAEAWAGVARAHVLNDEPARADRAIEQALDAARQVSQPEFRGWVLHDIALAQLTVGDLYGARLTAEKIEGERPQGAALAAVAEVQLRKGEIDAARTSASRIRDESSRGLVLRQIAAIEASRGRIDAATATAKDIDDSFYHSLACGDIAVAEVRRGNPDGALAQANRLRRKYRGPVYGRIAVAQIERGDVDAALRTVARIDDEPQRALAQARIAALRAAAGDARRAQELFAAALATIDQTVADRELRALVLGQVGRLQAASGASEAARVTLQRAVVDAAALDTGERRDDALDLVARGQAKLGDPAAALDTAKLVSDRVARALLIRDTISLQAEPTRAAVLARGTSDIGDPLAHTGALFGVLGVQLARPGDDAQATIDATRAAVRMIDDLEFRPPAFAALAAARVATGDVAGGRSIFEEALGEADAIARAERRAATYVRIVNALNERLMFLGQPLKRADDDPVRETPAEALR